MDDKVGCFNTGLYDKTWQPIYFYCIKNPIEGFQDWRFTAFYNSYTIKFTDIPTSVVSDLQRASYFANPRACLKIAFCKILSQFASGFMLDLGGVVGYIDEIQHKIRCKLGRKIVGMNFQTRSRATGGIFHGKEKNNIC